MKRIETSKKNWQKEMEACMSNNEQFVLITKDEKFAKALGKGGFNIGLLKIILMGSTIAATAVGTGATIVGGVAGLTGIAGIAAFSSIAAAADPEPVSKAILAVVAIICFALGAYFVYRLVKMLMSGKYKFTIRHTGILGSTWEVEGSPA